MRPLDSLQFVVPGDPVPKARPRLGRNGAVYTPKRTKAAENKVGWQAKIAMLGKAPTEDAVSIRVVAWCRKPKRLDLDNVVKLVLDAMNGIVWSDDSQVVQIVASKYEAVGEPHLSVNVETRPA